jgi:hypothetical protein
MNEKKEVWYFYNQLNKSKLGPFPIQELCLLLIKEKIEIDKILICQPGWKKWEKAEQQPSFLEEYNLQMNPLQEEDLPPIDELDEDGLPKIEIEELSNLPPQIPSNLLPKKVQIDPEIIQPIEVKKTREELRKHPRVSLELKIVFIIDKKSFRTKTLDVSLGGVKIVDPLPECYFDTTIQVFLTSPDQKFSIKFEADLLSNTTSKTHLQFNSKSSMALKHLEAWLIAVNEKQNKKTA